MNIYHLANSLSVNQQGIHHAHITTQQQTNRSGISGIRAYPVVGRRRIYRNFDDYGANGG